MTAPCPGIDAAAPVDALEPADAAPDAHEPCAPGTTACAGDVLGWCGGDGYWREQRCPLGCADDGPRCWDVAATPYLDGMLELARDRPALQLSGIIDTTTGAVTTWSGDTVDVPSLLLPGPPPIRVFAGSTVRVISTLIRGSYAAAFVSYGTLTLADHILVGDRETPGPGRRTEGCSAGVGSDGAPLEMGRAVDERFGGGGGGGHATAGGRGGGNPPGAGGTGGPAIADDALIGGCDGGGVVARGPDGSSAVVVVGAGGGGAAHFLSNTEILFDRAFDNRGVTMFADGATVDVAGAGGGGGGRIVLEAPELTFVLEVGFGHSIMARGGQGCGTCPPGGGQVCSGPVPTQGGHGGRTDAEPPTDGESLTGEVAWSRAGGGGGATGRIIVITGPRGITQPSYVFMPRAELRPIGRK